VSLATLSRVVPRRRVLLVEDDATLRGQLALALRSAGYDVIDLSNGQDALHFTSWNGDASPSPSPSPSASPSPSPSPSALDVDMIITDFRMPGVDGLELLGAARGSEPRVPVVMLFDATDADQHELAAGLGAAAVLTKPFGMPELMQALEKVTLPQS